MSSWAAAVAVSVLTACAAPGASGPPELPPAAAGNALPLKRHSGSGWPIDGASFTYAGSAERSTTVNGQTTHVDLTVRQRIRTHAATVRRQPVTDYRGTETDSGSGIHVTAAFDLYAAEISSKTRQGTDVWLVKSAAASNGTEATTTFHQGNGIVDRLPEVPQARWTNTAERTQTIDDASSSIADVYAADGSYDESVDFGNGAHASLQSYGDGNAVYQWPYQGAPRNSTITFSPPARNRVQIEFTNVTGFPVTDVFDVKSWYPSRPLVLASDGVRDLGAARVPAACKVPAKYARGAVALEENAIRLDVVFGEYETLQRTTYVAAPYGVVCLSLHDDVQTYYDYNALTFASKPMSDVTYDETLGLQQAHVPDGSASVAVPLDVHPSIVNADRRRKTARSIFESLRHLGKDAR
jgi:predicted small lipoprotein YifL